MYVNNMGEIRATQFNVQRSGLGDIAGFSWRAVFGFRVFLEQVHCVLSRKASLLSAGVADTDSGSLARCYQAHIRGVWSST